MSHEGQFEPLQTLFVLGALCVLHKRKYVAFVFLALAIQVKITALLFIPCFILCLRWNSCKGSLSVISVFFMGVVPTLCALLYYPTSAQIFSAAATLTYNPDHWNALNYEMFGWNPRWLVIMDQSATYGMLLLLAVWGVRRNEFKNYFASTGFLVFCKSSSLC